MPSNKVELKMTGNWKQMAAALDPKRFQANLDANMGKATRFNGMMVAGMIRKRIRGRRYTSNAPLTVLIKKSSTPLVDDGDLFGAVTSKNIDAYSVFVGVLRSAIGPDGQSLVNIAEFLHKGGSIPVTDAMRAMFIMLWEVGQGKRERSTLEGRAAELAKQLKGRIKQIKPLKASTKFIVVPPRPFLSDVLNDPLVLKRCRKNWEKAFQATLKAQASGSSSQGGAPGSVAKGSVPPKRAKKQPKPRKVRNRSEAAKKGWQTRKAKQQKAPQG